MFERFTERARQVVVHTQESARALNHNYLGTEHVLLGLLREAEGLGAQTLASFGLTYEQVETEIVRILGKGEHGTDGPVPTTPRLKKVLELALREALSLGHNYVGTEHILLGLVREGEGVGMRILLNHDLDPDKVRDEIIRRLSGSRRRPETAPVTVTFTVEPGQVWTDPAGVSWYLKFIEGDIAHLTRTVVAQRHVRDLVRSCHMPNDAVPEAGE